MKLDPGDILRIDGNYATAFIDSAFPHTKLFAYMLKTYTLYMLAVTNLSLILFSVKVCASFEDYMF